jgi:CheY-like chemotaxis protein
MRQLESLAPHLPFLRRYTRALTGDQATGDRYVRICLEALRHGDEVLDDALSPRVAFYRAFEAIWQSSGALLESRDADELPGATTTASRRLLRISPRSRQAFLLTSVEGFSEEEAAAVLSTSPSEIQALILEAQADIDAELATDVLIIEDEPIIASDIAELVMELGHRVTHIAPTRDEANAAARRNRPGLILADVQLADGSSGIDAAADILAEIDVPVIFITGFPERLLTGIGFEPTLLITKPFDPVSLKAAIGQALFFYPRAEEPAKRVCA